MFRRVLVANRGEIAVRVIRALHENDIEAVAVYSTADADSLHVRLADRAVRVGPPAAAESYLKIPSLIAAATTTGCEAVHPGYGFLAENPAFVEACADNDLVFIGPPADVMARMGDKVEAKREMRDADVPLVPGTEEETTVEQAREAAEEVGYPVLLKASAGGGGKGMRLVQEPDQLESAYGMAAMEAEAAFGDGSLYLEKAVSPARHVEIQVLCDSQGNVLTLGERECSIQRRHQKLIEESPSPALDDETREEMEAAAERACHSIGYRNAGTFEFLLGPDRSFYFIELNARLQVEHPVTELVTGIDIVREQLRVAAGEPLAHTGRAQRRGPRDRGSPERRGPAQRLRAGSRADHAHAAAARAGRAPRHARRGRLPRAAALRLAARQAGRLGRDPPAGDRPDAARTRRARARRRADHARAGDRHPPQRGVRQRPLLDRVPGRGRRAAAGDRGLVTEPLVFRGPEGSITLTAAAVTELVARAARSVDGVRLRRPRRAVEISQAEGRASVSLELGAMHGEPLPELARAVQGRVGEALARVTGLEVAQVDVEIAEIG